MTLKQEAHSMIEELQDEESVQFFVTMLRQYKTLSRRRTSDSLPEPVAKRQAYKRMEEMKKAAGYPKNYDYEQVRREAMTGKYGSSN